MIWKTKKNKDRHTQIFITSISARLLLSYGKFQERHKISMIFFFIQNDKKNYDFQIASMAIKMESRSMDFFLDWLGLVWFGFVIAAYFGVVVVMLMLQLISVSFTFFFYNVTVDTIIVRNRNETTINNSIDMNMSLIRVIIWNDVICTNKRMSSNNALLLLLLLLLCTCAIDSSRCWKIYAVFWPLPLTCRCHNKVIKVYFFLSRR